MISKKIPSRIAGINQVKSGLNSEIPENRRIAASAIAIEIGLLAKYNAIGLSLILEKHTKLILSDLIHVNQFVEELLTFVKREATDTKMGTSTSLLKIKYLYWQLKGQSPFTQKKPKRTSLSKIQKLLDLESSKKLPDPLIMKIWLVNDAHEEDILKEKSNPDSDQISSPFIGLRDLSKTQPLNRKQILLPQIGGEGFFNSSKTSSRLVDSLHSDARKSPEINTPIGSSKFKGFSSLFDRIENLQEEAEEKKKHKQKRRRISLSVDIIRGQGFSPTQNGSEKSPIFPSKEYSPSFRITQLQKIEEESMALKRPVKLSKFKSKTPNLESSLNPMMFNSRTRRKSLNINTIERSGNNWKKAKVILVVKKRSNGN